MDAVRVKQQFNVNLDPHLVRSIKHRAIDAQLSLSDLVSNILEQHLQKEATVNGRAKAHAATHGARAGHGRDRGHAGSPWG